MKPIFFLLFISLFTSCAKVGQLNGGPKDTAAPKIDSLHSTRNFQTNFTPKEIDLTFNEWIKLDDAFNQIVISPPLDKKPTYSLEGRTVRIKFHPKEVLKPEATYTINLGEAVRDLTEGNKVKNLSFVFSTGATLDSLKVKAKIIHPLTEEPIENVLFALYENQQDSAVSKEKPFYFARTNKQGECMIENVKKGKFKVFALKDANATYRYDLANEEIGFLDNTISTDTIKNTFLIRLAAAPPLPKLIDKTTSRYGVVKLGFNERPFQFVPTILDKNVEIYLENSNDTTKIWYTTTLEKWSILANKDTINVKTPNKEAFLKTAKVFIPNISSGIGVGGKTKGAATTTVETNAISLLPGKPIELLFNTPITSFDTLKIVLTSDSLKGKRLPIQVKIDSALHRKVMVNTTLKEQTTYFLQLLPQAVTDLFGVKNDTIIGKYFVPLKKNFSNIQVKATHLEPNYDYILQLLNKENKVIEEHIAKKRTNTFFQYTFKTVALNEYKLRLIEDRDANERWTAGDYYKKRQPEKVRIKVLEPLKADWDVETELDFSLEYLPTEPSPKKEK